MTQADESRVEVATLDGVPVYHWRTFKSVVPGDVDRLLILREFERKKFKLPPKLVDDAVHDKVAKEASGDPDKFASQLREQGSSIADFRSFTSEEIILQAMLYNKGQDVWYSAKAREKWLKELRAHAVVKKLTAEPRVKD